MLTAVVIALVQHVTGLGGNSAPPSQDPGAPPSKLRSGDLVKIDSVVLEHNWGLRGGSFVFPQAFRPSAADLAALNAVIATGDSSRTGAYDDWFRSRGAIDPGVTNFKLVLRGNSTQQVRITDMRIRAQCAAPASGTYFYSPPAGNDESLRLSFDLDQVDPTATYQTPDGKERPYFADHSVSLQPNEQLVLEVEASTVRRYCRFTPVLSVVNVAGATEQVVTRPDGRPFEVTAVPDDTTPTPFAGYAAVYAGGVVSIDGQFRPVDPKTFAPGGPPAGS